MRMLQARFGGAYGDVDALLQAGKLCWQSCCDHKLPAAAGCSHSGLARLGYVSVVTDAWRGVKLRFYFLLPTLLMLSIFGSMSFQPHAMKGAHNSEQDGDQAL